MMKMIILYCQVRVILVKIFDPEVHFSTNHSGAIISGYIKFLRKMQKCIYYENGEKQSNFCEYLAQKIYEMHLPIFFQKIVLHHFIWLFRISA